MENINENEKFKVADDNLENVSGGGFSGKVGMYDGIAGQYDGEYYWFVKDSDSDIWCWGKLLKSYEDHIIFNITKRTHEVLIVKKSDAFREGRYDNGYSATLRGDDWSMYKYRT